MCPALTASSACPTPRTGSITTNMSASTSCSATSSPPPYEPGTDQGIGPAPGARIGLEIAALALALASVALTLCRGPPARAGLGEHRSRLAAPQSGDQGLGQGCSRARRTDRSWRIAACQQQ